MVCKRFGIKRSFLRLKFQLLGSDFLTKTVGDQRDLIGDKTNPQVSVEDILGACKNMGYRMAQETIHYIDRGLKNHFKIIQLCGLREYWLEG